MTQRGARRRLAPLLFTALAAHGCADGDGAPEDAAPRAKPALDDPTNRRIPLLDPDVLRPPGGACAAGERVVDLDADGKPLCAPCEAATYSTAENTTACLPWSDCLPGQYVEAEPSATQDRVCAACPPGTHSLRPNLPQCVADTDCAPGTYAVDVHHCQACPAGTYSSATNSSDCTACEAGSYCPSGSSEPESCEVGNWDHDADPSTECQHWTQCPDGFREVGPGTALTDRECSPGTWYHALGQHGGEASGTVAVDAAGDVYVAAVTLGDIDGRGSRGGSDIFVRKFSGVTGTELWRVQFGSADSEGLAGIALDPAGALVIVGGDPSNYDKVFVRKLAAEDGELEWSVMLDTWGSPRAVHVSASGNIAVAGRLSNHVPVVIQLNAAGETLWELQLADTRGEAGGVAFDSGGDLAVSYSVTAFRPGDDYLHQDAYVQLLSGDDGTLLWSTDSLELSWSNRAGEVLSDGSDRLLVRVDGGDEAETDDTAHLALLDSRDGTLLWSRTYDEEDRLHAACFDAEDEVLAMTSGGTLQRLSSEDGSVLGADSVSEGEYAKQDVASTPTGDVVVTSSNGSTVLLNANDGSERWSDSLTTDREDAVYSVAFDGSGDVILGASTETAFDRVPPNLAADALVRKLSGATGEPVWTRQFGSDEPDAVYAVTTDALGDVFAGGSLAMSHELNAVGGWDAFVSKLSGTDGTTLWSTQFDSATREAVQAIAIDAHGDAVVTGYSGRTSDALLSEAFARKLAGSDGSLLWETPLPEAGRMTWTASVGVMPNGDAVVGWVGYNEPSGVLRLSALDGSIVWEVILDGDGFASYEIHLGVDAAGDVALLGNGEDVALMKLSGEDGSELWSVTVRLGGPLVFDPAGDLFVASGDLYRKSIVHISGADGSFLGDGAALGLRDAWHEGVAVTATGDIVLAGYNAPVGAFDTDGFVVKLLR